MKGNLQDHDVAGYRSPLGVTATQIARLADFRTGSGYQFPYIDVCYQTLGELSPRKDNVILVCHALSGNARVAGLADVDGRPGWWDLHVGPGKAIDTSRFHVICSNVLGGCGGSTGPSSPRPDKRRAQYGPDFPPITIWDMVAAQARLLDHLGIERLFAVVGGSFGGMQALAWAGAYPERVQSCVPIATCLAHRASQIAFNEIARQAVVQDPNWKGGRYTPSASRAEGSPWHA